MIVPPEMWSEIAEARIASIQDDHLDANTRDSLEATIIAIGERHHFTRDQLQELGVIRNRQAAPHGLKGAKHA